MQLNARTLGVLAFVAALLVPALASAQSPAPPTTAPV